MKRRLIRPSIFCVCICRLHRRRFSWHDPLQLRYGLFRLLRGGQIDCQQEHVTLLKDFVHDALLRMALRLSCLSGVSWSFIASQSPWVLVLSLQRPCPAARHSWRLAAGLIFPPVSRHVAGRQGGREVRVPLLAGWPESLKREKKVGRALAGAARVEP